MLQKLKKFRVPKDKLKLIFYTFIRPLVEYACPVWHFALTQDEIDKIERVQKRSLQIIYGGSPLPYSFYLKEFKLESLSSRREKLCQRFGSSLLQHPIYRSFLPPPFVPIRSRPPREVAEKVPKLTPVHCNTMRYSKSFVPSFVKYYNDL